MPLVVVLGAFLIGVLFVIMGAAGGLFTAAFQITVLGTKGPLGINTANTVKPTNLFLTLCSPLTGLIDYFRDRRFALPPAIFFAIISHLRYAPGSRSHCCRCRNGASHDPKGPHA